MGNVHSGPVLTSPAQLLYTHARHLWSQSVSCLVFLFSFLAVLFSQHYCFIQRTQPSHDVPEGGQLQFCHFYLQQCSRLNLL